MLISLARYPSAFLAFAISAIALNDIVFVPLGAVFSGPLYEIAGAWREICAAVAICLFLVSRRIVDRAVLFVCSVVVVLAAYGIFLGMHNDASLTATYAGVRRFCVPLLLAYAIYLSGIFAHVTPRTVFWAVLIPAIAMTLYAFYTYMMPASEYKALWHYEFVAAQKQEAGVIGRFIEYQFVRDGRIRASGFFVSAIEFSLFCVVAFTLSVSAAVAGARGLPRAAFLLLAVFFVAGIYVSQVRAGLLSACLALLVVLAFHALKKLRPAPFLALPIALATISLAIVALLGAGVDASTAGRIPHYAAFTSEFQFPGYGFVPVVNNGPTFRDSWYLSTAMTFGVLSPVYWLCFLFPLILVNGVDRDGWGSSGGYMYPIFLSYIALVMVHLFNAAFHYSVGNAHVALILIIGAYVASRRSMGGTSVDLAR